MIAVVCSAAAQTGPTFAPHPDPKGFRPVADPAAWGAHPGDHPPYQGPFGPADDSVVVFDVAISLYWAPVPGDRPFASLAAGIGTVTAVWWDDLDADPHLEMVVLGTTHQPVAHETPEGTMHGHLDLPHNVVVDWDGRELVRLALPGPAATAFAKATDAASARAALRLRPSPPPCVPRGGSGCSPSRPCCERLVDVCAPDGRCKPLE